MIKANLFTGAIDVLVGVAVLYISRWWQQRQWKRVSDLQSEPPPAIVRCMSYLCPCCSAKLMPLGWINVPPEAARSLIDAAREP